MQFEAGIDDPGGEAARGRRAGAGGVEQIEQQGQASPLEIGRPQRSRRLRRAPSLEAMDQPLGDRVADGQISVRRNRDDMMGGARRRAQPDAVTAARIGDDEAAAAGKKLVSFDRVGAG